MDQIAQLMDNLALTDGVNPTTIKNINIFKASTYRPREPLCYEKGLLFVSQGSKEVYLDGKTFEYNKDNYLVSCLPLPAECETKARDGKPVLVMTIAIDPVMISSLVSKINEHSNQLTPTKKEKHMGLSLAPLTTDIKESLRRLLICLQSPLESEIIGESLLKELMFRVLCQKSAAPLYELINQNSNLSRVDRALRLIHSNYHENIKVDSLANLVNMSPSVFHRAFKEVTASSPIQYIKKIRLDKAKALIVNNNLLVSEAAAAVGYESASQFSREFKRYFGSSPIEYSKEL
ncbi:MAG: AraC family transcriptional regulator [Desulfotalea sp.]